MNSNFVNRKDRIIASAIEIISESGLSSLNTKTLAMKENMSESLLYRYFGGKGLCCGGNICGAG